MKDIDILPGDMIQHTLGTCWLVVSVRQLSRSFSVFVLTPFRLNHHIVLKFTRCHVHDACCNYTLWFLIGWQRAWLLFNDGSVREHRFTDDVDYVVITRSNI